MEVVVRAVPGVRSCFAALPLPVIQALERTAAAGSLPAVLALELRTPDAFWRLAWAGAVSASSSAVEVTVVNFGITFAPSIVRVEGHFFVANIVKALLSFKFKFQA